MCRGHVVGRGRGGDRLSLEETSHVKTGAEMFLQLWKHVLYLWTFIAQEDDDVLQLTRGRLDDGRVSAEEQIVTTRTDCDCGVAVG